LDEIVDLKSRPI